MWLSIHSTSTIEVPVLCRALLGAGDAGLYETQLLPFEALYASVGCGEPGLEQPEPHVVCAVREAEAGFGEQSREGLMTCWDGSGLASVAF